MIHFGGGTPSLIGPVTWNRFTERLREHAAFDRATEIAVETDPEDVSSERVDAWCRTGVTRVSIGIQSFDDEVLRYMRRHHDRPTAVASVKELQRAGVGNINVDLMYGMPYRPFESWLADLEVRYGMPRSGEHTSELQSRPHLRCPLLPSQTTRPN